MRCGQVRKKLGAYADGELPGKLRARLEDHMATCGACGTELASLRSLGALLAGLPDPGLPEGLETSILDAALRPGSRRRPAPLWTWALRAAAALLVASAGAALGMRSAGRLPAPSPLPAQAAPANSAEGLYAGSFDLLPPDSPGAQVLSLFQEGGR